MRSKSQYSFVQYSISKSDAQKWNVLRSRSASFERTMPCPLTIPKTNKKTFHVISRKKIQIHLSHRGAHAKPIPGWKVRQMSLEHTHTHKVTERLIKLLQQLYKNLHIVLRRKVPTNSLISHLRGSVTFCDNPDVPKIETFHLAERPKSATLATSQSRFHFEHRS